MKTLLKSLILLCLVLAMLMSAAGCGIPGFDGGQSEKQESTDNSSAVSSTGKPAGVINAFTMSYDHDSSLNPYSCEDKYNLLITQLMFEGLFVLNDNFETENLLCSIWETQDGKVFEINVTESIKFSDGSNLKAIDVAYSINEARMSGKYARRKY